MSAVRISKDHLSKLEALCSKEKMSKKDYFECMIDYFEKNKISPKSYTTNDAIRNTILSFIKKQEQMFLSPMKNDLTVLNDSIVEIKTTLEFLLEVKNKDASN